MIEADFQREYHIDLVEDLPTMTWRKFFTLISGLSPMSLFKLTIQKQEEVLEGEEGEMAVENIGW